MIFFFFFTLWKESGLLESGVSADLGVSNYLASARTVAQRGRNTRQGSCRWPEMPAKTEARTLEQWQWRQVGRHEVLLVELSGLAGLFISSLIQLFKAWGDIAHKTSKEVLIQLKYWWEVECRGRRSREEDSHRWNAGEGGVGRRILRFLPERMVCCYWL